MRRRRFGWLVGAAVLLVLAGGWLLTGRPVRYGAFAQASTARDTATPVFRTERVTLTTTTGRRLDCLVRTPTHPPTAMPAPVLVAGGLRTGRRAVLYVSPAFDGVAMSCDYPWEDLVSNSVPGVVLRLPRLRAEMVATPSALGIEARYLAARADVGSRPLAVVGASLGVPPVVTWAARDTLARAVALLYGGGKLRLLLEAELRDEIDWAWLRHLSAVTLAWLLGPIEPTRSVGAIAPRPLLIVAAANDERVPRESALALFAAAREPKRLVWFGGEHMRPTDAAITAALTDTSLAFFAAELPARR